MGTLRKRVCELYARATRGDHVTMIGWHVDADTYTKLRREFKGGDPMFTCDLSGHSIVLGLRVVAHVMMGRAIANQPLLLSLEVRNAHGRTLYIDDADTNPAWNQL